MTQQGITIARRLTRTIGPLTCAVTLLVSTAGWATGTTTRPPRTSIEDGSTADHALGSQIRRHEKTANTDPSRPATNSATVDGIDVSGHQDRVDWRSWWDSGVRFAYVKATEGTDFRSDSFGDQYDGAAEVGMIRGAYHFALPNSSSGAQQANFFVDNGGAWSSDGRTLPGVLDMEYNPYGADCYDKSPAELHEWITEFSTTYHDRTDRWPVIYTSKSWWNSCVGNSARDSIPLWIARYADSTGELPTGWDTWTFWQHTSKPLDKNQFNGTHQQLRTFATD